MKKYFLFLFLLVLSKNILCDYQYQVKEFSNNFISAQLEWYFKEKSKNFDGFIKGTLVKSICDYVPIEQLQSGDTIASLTGDQEIIATTKTIINGNIYYALTTQEHGFYIYPEKYVHNMDVALMPTETTVAIGLLEVVNPVTALIGIIMPLSVYAFNYYLNIKKDQKIELEEALQNAFVVQQTRNYYEFKRKGLSTLYQNLTQIQNGLILLLNANDKTRLSFSFALMNSFQMKPYDFPLLPSVLVEIKYSVADKQKLLLLRDQELQDLETKIIDLEMLLVFHVNELIERRDAAYVDLQKHMKIVDQYAAWWNQNLHCLPYDLVINSYRAAFAQEALSVDLENKINEINFISMYYGKLSNQILQKSSNVYEVLQNQIYINTTYMQYLASLKDNFHKWVDLDEQYLRNAGALTYQLIECFRNEANKRVFDKENAAIFQAKKKREGMKEQQKELEQKKDNGEEVGGDPEKDPDDDDEQSGVSDYFVNSLKHVFRQAEGHFSDTPENRKLLLDMASKVKNRLGIDIRGNVWYGEILDNGKQIWAWTRDNLIRDAGFNKIPRIFNQKTGLCRGLGNRL